MRYLLILITILITACSSEKPYEGNGEIVEKVDAALFQKVINQGGILVDCRTPDEFNDGHINGAKNIDILEENFVDNINAMDKSQTVFVYCRSGGRSKNASKILKTAGFSKIYDLEGGYTAWREAGFEANL